MRNWILVIKKVADIANRKFGVLLRRMNSAKVVDHGLGGVRLDEISGSWVSSEQLLGSETDESLPQDHILVSTGPIISIINTLDNPVGELLLNLEAPAAIAATNLEYSRRAVEDRNRSRSVVSSSSACRAFELR